MNCKGMSICPMAKPESRNRKSRFCKGANEAEDMRAHKNNTRSAIVTDSNWLCLCKLIRRDWAKCQVEMGSHYFEGLMIAGDWIAGDWTKYQVGSVLGRLAIQECAALA